MGAITLPILAMGIVVVGLAVRPVIGLWRRTEGSPVRRAGAERIDAGAVRRARVRLVAELRALPARSGPYEGGTLLNAVSAPLAAAGYQASVAPSADGGEILTVLPSSGQLPTEAEPQLALVLVPSGESAEAIEPSWVFPFNEPLPPQPGDNQALAVNTTDDSASYDVAIAMVWVTDDDPVLNVNEAYAFASCSDCVTVSVAFQVVVIVGSANVVVPQNLSAAVNYECFECITTAIASQLVVTVDSLPGVEQQIALADVWEDVAAFAVSIPSMSLADVIAQIEDYKEQIVTILGVAPLALPSSTPTPSGSPTTSPAPTPDATPSADSSTGATPGTTSSPPAVVQETATPEPTISPEPTPTPSPSSSAAP